MYLAELVVGMTGDQLAVVSAEVIADESHLLQRFSPGTAQAHQVCPVDPAIAEEAPPSRGKVSSQAPRACVHSRALPNSRAS